MEGRRLPTHHVCHSGGEQGGFKRFKVVDFSSKPWEPAESLQNLNRREAPPEALHRRFKFRFYLLRTIAPHID